MSTALDHVRYFCGGAGEEVANRVDELEAENAALQAEKDSWQGRFYAAEAIISAKDAEIIEQCRINGIVAERELTLLGQIGRQSTALKLAREALIGALSDDQPYINASKEALAAINEVLGE